MMLAILEGRLDSTRRVIVLAFDGEGSGARNPGGWEIKERESTATSTRKKEEETMQAFSFEHVHAREGTVVGRPKNGRRAGTRRRRLQVPVLKHAGASLGGWGCYSGWEGLSVLFPVLAASLTAVRSDRVVRASLLAGTPALRQLRRGLRDMRQLRGSASRVIANRRIW